MENSRPRFRAWDQRDCVKHYWYEDDVCTHGDIWNIGHMEGNSIEQFTGLFDKNGKEIYEGDIVIIFSNRNVKVTYYLGSFGYHMIESGSFISFSENEYFRFCDKNTSDEIEIIGNIHQNPEILEGQE